MLERKRSLAKWGHTVGLELPEGFTDFCGKDTKRVKLGRSSRLREGFASRVVRGHVQVPKL